MCRQERLCLVEDTFYVTGRGLVLMTSQWQTGQVKAGDWIELHASERSSRIACVKSIEMVRFTPGGERVVDAAHPGGLLLPNLTREDVKRGDEVWSVVNPPPEQT